MKRNFKGFTLVECIVALAILGIASLVMAQIYAGVSRTNLNNHAVNTSLSYQMKLVEEATKSDSVTISYTENNDKTNKKVNASATNKVEVTELEDDMTTPTTNKYYYGCDTYVLFTRDADNLPSSDASYSGVDEKDINLRYKYMLGHAPTT